MPITTDYRTYQTIQKQPASKSARMAFWGRGSSASSEAALWKIGYHPSWCSCMLNQRPQYGTVFPQEEYMGLGTNWQVILPCTIVVWMHMYSNASTRRVWLPRARISQEWRFESHLPRVSHKTCWGLWEFRLDRSGEGMSIRCGPGTNYSDRGLLCP